MSQHGVTVTVNSDKLSFKCQHAEFKTTAHVGEDGGVAFMPPLEGEHVPTALAGLTAFFTAYPDIQSVLAAERTSEALVYLNQAKLVRAGDYIVDGDTGEFVADYQWGYGSDIQTLEDVTTYGARVQASDAIYAAHLEQRQLVIDQMDAILKRDLNRREYYAQWEPALREWAEAHKMGKQTIDIPAGKIAFRKAAFVTKVVLRKSDDPAIQKEIEAMAVAWCLEHDDFAHAVKTVHTILVGALDKAAQENPKQVFPQDLFDIEVGEESCTLSTGFRPTEKLNHKIPVRKKLELITELERKRHTAPEIEDLVPDGKARRSSPPPVSIMDEED